MSLQKVKQSRLSVFDWSLVLLSVLLAVIGIALIYSSTAPMGDVGRTLVLKQMTWCSLGIVLMAVFLLFDYHLLERWAIWIYAGIVVALIAVWTLGEVTAGSKRWIEVGVMRFQPSEFAKLAVVIMLAKYFQDRGVHRPLEVRDLIQPLLIALIPALLVLVEPDLGTAGVICLVGGSMILLGGVGRRALMWAGIVLICALPLLYMVGDRALMDYQKRRLATFLDPYHDPLGSGYHIIQSQIAIGSGGAVGKGFMNGTQNRLMFLPVKHTDFIFSILAEEWGFIGCMTVMLMFGALFLRGLAAAGKARDTFGAMVAFGCVMVLFWHVTINIGMVMGLVPVVGVPLSFLSYGGSSLLASFLAIAVMVNVSIRRFSY